MLCGHLLIYIMNDSFIFCIKVLNFLCEYDLIPYHYIFTERNMVIDSLKNCAVYCSCHPLFEAAFNFLKKCTDENLPAGRYELAGKDLYAIVFEYELSEKPEPEYEAHKEYIDIQYMAAGSEAQWYDAVDNLYETVPYNHGKDVAFYSFNENSGSRLLLEEGFFAVYYPQDGHLPQMYAGKAERCKRVVVKIKC